MRTVTNFNADWKFSKIKELVAVDAVLAGEQWEAVELPHTWNAVDGQDGGNDYYRGTCQYVKDFEKPVFVSDKKVYIEFNGAAMTSDVYVNGTAVAHHEGGYSTFRADITDLLVDGTNRIAVLVDNDRNDRVYPQKADFTFYGGLYRDVNLVTVSPVHFELEKDGTPGIKVTPSLQEDGSAVVTVETWQNADEEVTVEIFAPNGCGASYWRELRKADKSSTADAQSIAKTAAVSEDGHAIATLEISDAVLWEGTDKPYLYIVKASVAGKDEVETRFGVRTIDFKPEAGFFLNGESYPLRGVSRHQDRAGVGNALTPAMHEEDMDIILDIGANTVRLAHYQQAQYFYDLCDEAGLVVWAEIPYITQHMPNGRENTLSQMRELITQSYNHPSIVCWGLSNEITASNPVTDDLLENHQLLNDLCHRMDATRPTTMAHVFMLEIDSPLIDIADIGSYNLYFGWYLGELTQNDEFFDEYHTKYPNRVIGFSEYGADANPQYQSDAPERGDYTETYQCVYHEHILKCIEERPYLWATHVWNLFDFAADGRDEGGKHGVNQKGLVTIDRKEYKDAYFAYKANWSKDSFVHLCGKRFIDRVGETTEIRVYSNCDHVTLKINGEVAGEQDGRCVFVFNVPLTGDMNVEVSAVNAAGETFTDEGTIKKVEKKNPDYVMAGQEEVVNWFDKDEIDGTCFSIEDTYGDLMANADVKALVGQFMLKAVKSRGEVAESSSSNANMEAMMAKMKFSAMLKMAANVYTSEEIQEFNKKLQSIKK